MLTNLAAFFAGLLLGAVAVFLIMLRSRGAARQQLVEAFKALAADTLHQNSSAFLQMAEGKLRERELAASAQLDKKSAAIDEMIKPVKETLQRMDEQLRALEVKREGAYRELAEMVSASRETQLQLRQETGQLLQALRAPTGRGRWGELQLQRILEMTGMSEHTRDFTLQGTIAGEEGAIRPDAVVALPGNRCIVIDSKVPLSAYLDAVQSNDELARLEAIKKHARQLKDHIKQLSAKAYWERMEGTPAFVVLFLPGEHFLSSALEGDPGLMEFSAAQNVVLATPMTLIALLRTVAYGWRQEAISKNMRQITDMGRKLYVALVKFAEHMKALGNRLDGAVTAYNNAVGSLERNALERARQLGALGVTMTGEEIPELETVNKRPRAISISKTTADLSGDESD